MYGKEWSGRERGKRKRSRKGMERGAAREERRTEVAGVREEDALKVIHHVREAENHPSEPRKGGIEGTDGKKE